MAAKRKRMANTYDPLLSTDEEAEVFIFVIVCCDDLEDCSLIVVEQLK